MKRSKIYILSVIIVIFLLHSCSSSKSSGNFLSRGYHNMTAFNNGYFNAKTNLESNELTFELNVEDDYTKMLSIFKYPDEANAQSASASMDEIIKKNSIVIQLHPKSKWVDDSYFLIGKSNFYKRNYAEALTSFQYIISEYASPKKKKKKTKKKSNDSELSILEQLQHQPIHNESSLWVVRTLIEMKEFNTANTALSVIKSNSKFPENLLGELYAVEADAAMKQGDLIGAMDPLIKSIELTKNKKEKARYQFVLAQLYVYANENAKAIESLKNVIALKPDYKMDFYARLNMVSLMMENSIVTNDGTKKMLLDMLKQEKYKEFNSLLFNTLAGIEIAENNLEASKTYLLKSVRDENGDAIQHAYAFMQLGDIYYSSSDFIPAYNYYDSSLIGLPKTFERFNEIILRRDGLIDLVKELKIIETEKKLQYLATLSESDLEKELDKIIPKQETNESGEEFLDDTKPKETETETVSDFYFYNTSLRSRGFNEFKQTWGNRKLEDNWRRSDKTANVVVEDDLLVNVDTSLVEIIDLTSKDLTRDALIASLPKSEDQIKISNARIASALYNSGSIYKQNFGNIAKASENFSENISSFPKNKNELQSYYQLYLISSGALKENYKNAILTNYPNSLFANIILDPDFISKQKSKDALVENYYEKEYSAYLSDSINALKIMLSNVDSLFKTNPLKAKFDMLSALSLAAEGKSEPFVNALQDITRRYPKDEVGIKAKEILASMGKDNKPDLKKNDVPANYVFKAEEEQYCMAVMNGTGKESSTLKNNFANFNGGNFSLLNLKVSSLLLGKDKTLILIKSFKDANEAMPYYNKLIDDANITKEVNVESITFFIISKSNYIQFYKNKDVSAYELFFEENYLETEEDE